MIGLFKPGLCEPEERTCIQQLRAGRHMARRHGLKVMGVLGIPLEAKRHGLIDLLKPHLDALRHRAGFFISEQLYEKALHLADENG